MQTAMTEHLTGRQKPSAGLEDPKIISLNT